MGVLDRIKAVFNPQQYFASSIRPLEGAGLRGSKPRDFNYHEGVRQFRSWVYAAANLNAQRAASQPLRLYVRKRSGTKCLFNTRSPKKKTLQYLNGDMAGEIRPSSAVMQKIMEFGDDFQEVTESHPVTDLIRNASRWMNGFEMNVLRFLHLELTGNAYMHPILERSTGDPVELWPMPPQWTWVIPDRDEFIRGYLYGQTMAEAIEFELDEVIHFRYPNPRNLYYGLGKVEAGWDVVSVNDRVHRMDYAFYDNFARPDYAVIIEGGANDDVLEKFEQNIKEKFQGVNKAGHFLTMTGKVSLQPMNWPPKDMQGREEIVEEIAAVFGTPVTLLKANDPNLASSETGFRSWKENTILPMLRFDEEVLNNVLLPMFGIEDDAVLSYDNPVPEDRKFDLERHTRFVQGGIMTRNEVRLSEGLDEVEGGDELMLPAGLSSVQDATRNPFDGLRLLTADSDATLTKRLPEDRGRIRPADLVSVVEAYHEGRLPKESAEAILMVSYGMEKDQADKILSERKEPNDDDDDGSSGSDGDGGLSGSDHRPAGDGPDSDGDSPDGGDEPDPPDDSGGERPADTKGSDDPEGTVLKQSAVWTGEGCCGCRESDSAEESAGERLCKSVIVKAEETGDADDTARDAEPVSLLSSFIGSIAEVLERERAAILSAMGVEPGKAVRTKISANELSSILGGLSTRLQTEFASIVENDLREIYRVSGQAGIDQVTGGRTFDVSPFAALVRSEALKLAGAVSESTIRAVEGLVQRGVTQGLTTRELATQIQQAEDIFGRSRAETIARTEMARTHVEGKERGWEQSGVVKGKKWLLAPNACEFCRRAAADFAENEKGLGEPFYAQGTTIVGANGGRMTLDYSDINGPPLHPNCRCDIIPVLITD